ncbi:hypothetical protein Tco_1143283 [Tanacetum coccineum]
MDRSCRADHCLHHSLLNLWGTETYENLCMKCDEGDHRQEQVRAAESVLENSEHLIIDPGWGGERRIGECEGSKDYSKWVVRGGRLVILCIYCANTVSEWTIGFHGSEYWKGDECVVRVNTRKRHLTMWVVREKWATKKYVSGIGGGVFARVPTEEMGEAETLMGWKSAGGVRQGSDGREARGCDYVTDVERRRGVIHNKTVSPASATALRTEKT